ncbi:hypothetical protein C8Q80DRAFT_394216 [Daedaleopsis nitida]|nr:hypothetical protein C8Q80DRAFT_394216 [Daedaleopsis nitida]
MSQESIESVTDSVMHNILQYPQGAQHRALHIVEIVRHVCQVADQNTLAVLARTCKLFYETALQTLWTGIPDLVPLIKCFPADAWVIENSEIRFSRLPMPEDWERFLRHARLVQILVFSWAMLRMEVPALPTVLSFVGHQLTKISINGWDQRHVPEQVLRCAITLIAPRSRQCRSFNFSFYGSSSNLSPTATSYTPTVEYLAQLGTLREAHIRLPDIWAPTTRISRPFSRLTKITLHTTTEAYIIFSKAMSLPNIVAMDMSIIRQLTAHLVPELFLSIRRQLFPDVFRQLSIYPEQDPKRATALRTAAVIRSVDLRPLLEFPSVDSFHCSFECHHELDDALFLDIAKTWTELSYFRLSAEHVCIHNSLPSITALAHFATYSHNLVSLGLTVDAAGWDGISWEIWDDHSERVRTAGPAPHHYGELAGRASDSHVYSLHVGTSPISRPEHIALFLARIFPRVEEPLTLYELEEYDPDGTSLEEWREVDRYLPMFMRFEEVHEQFRNEEEGCNYNGDDEEQ